MRQVAVFDTNILFSATGWRGRPYQCLELARSGAIEDVTCQEILDEFSDKLKYKLHFSAEEVLQCAVDLLPVLRLVPITGALRVIDADPDDDKVLECAVVAGATHIVTGDRRHLLPLRTFRGVSIVSAAEFLALVPMK
jgi:putative PIN family toxin of toxin-antitoxin system